MPRPEAGPATADPAALPIALAAAVARALAEDLGTAGDLTAAATVAADASGSAEVVARADGVVCGTAAVVEVFRQFDPGVTVTPTVVDGATVEGGDVVARLTGALRSILAGERTALNLVGHLSGIATRTRAFVDAVGGRAAVRDTRKTTPGLRLLDKYAVRVGGGCNHRLRLDDALLVKDNHHAAAGSVAGAVAAALAGAHGRPVQVEVASLGQLDDALAAGATDVLLDNFTPADVRAAVERTAGRASLEASGTITLDTCGAYAATGVDRLAVGSITHSAPWLDVALDVRLAATGR